MSRKCILINLKPEGSNRSRMMDSNSKNTCRPSHFMFLAGPQRTSPTNTKVCHWLSEWLTDWVLEFPHWLLCFRNIWVDKDYKWGGVLIGIDRDCRQETGCDVKASAWKECLPAAVWWRRISDIPLKYNVPHIPLVPTNAQPLHMKQ